MKLPAFDPHRLLVAAETAILGRTKVVDNSAGATRKATSWLNGAIVLLVVLGAFVAYSWVSWRRKKELAKLRHERNAQRIEIENNEAKAKVAESTDVAKYLRKRRDILQEDFRLLDIEARAEVKRYEADMHAIDRISDWSELELGIR